MEQAQAITVLGIVAIIISSVAFITTVIGFFASLKFYRDGVRLQGLANDALVKIEEKTSAIQSQVGGMFEKTLDAAIGRGDKLSENFEALNEQLETATKTITESALTKIDSAGEGERKRLSGLIEQQISLLRERVNETRESAEEITDLMNIPVQKKRTEEGNWWKAFLRFVGTRNRAMANILKEWNVILEGNRVNLIPISSPNSFGRSYIDDPEHREQLNEYLHHFLNKNIDLRIDGEG